MKIKLYPFRTLPALILITLGLPASTALAQPATNIVISGISHEIQIDAVAGNDLPAPIDVSGTNPEFDYANSMAASDSGASGNVGASQMSSVILTMDSTNQILYVTGSAAATSSAFYAGNVLGITGSGTCSSAFEVDFTVSGTCNYILQAGTSYSQPWFAGGTPSYPQCFVGLSGVTNATNAEYGYSNRPFPEGGLVTGTISGRAGLVADIFVSSEAGSREGYPPAVTQNASLSYALTIYPAGIGAAGISGATNNPVLGISYDGTNIILSWPVSYPNYLLTSTTNLASSNWPVVPTPPGIVGSLWEVTNSAAGNSQFFRLEQAN
jgi:hypothetical protein